jgi:methylase of polypeptide subunit release factors
LSQTKQDGALLELGQILKRAGYRFITPTPLTHSRVLARTAPAPAPEAASPNDIFGWSRRFSAAALDPALLSLMRQADIVDAAGNELFRSRVRFSSLDDLLFVHSAYPTEDANAVFFGPDTYRFVRAVKEAHALYAGLAPKVIVDIGTGSGAGGIAAARIFGERQISKLVLTDINALALRYAAINAALNGIARAEIRESDVLAQVPEQGDLIIANPPYLLDGKARTYRHGGGQWGTELSLRILTEGLARLSPGGILVLYTGTPVLDGTDVFGEEALPLLEQSGARFRYSEMDPDVFGEELAFAPYDAADRIAAVALVAEAPMKKLAHAP